MFARTVRKFRPAVAMRDDVIGCYFVGSHAEPATVRSARSNGSGNTRPRTAARRRIPAHAFGLK